MDEFGAAFSVIGLPSGNSEQRKSFANIGRLQGLLFVCAGKLSVLTISATQCAGTFSGK